METETPSPAAPGAVTSRGDRMLPLVLLVAVALVGGLLVAYRPAATPSGPHTPSTAGGEPANWTPSPRPAGETVSLTVDFGNGARREFTLPWTEGMTVGELMERARDALPGIAFSQQGEGKMAFLTSLEGVANEQGASGRYWLYSVDGQHAKVSFAEQPVDAGAAILWEFRRGE
jgi:hypothetical protein